MTDYTRWHSIKSDVYHSSSECRTGNNIEDEYFQYGSGGRRLCEECRRLGVERPEAGDLAGVTFDRVDGSGEPIKFLWGVATAGQQVEGGLETSEWASYTKSPIQQARVKFMGSQGGTALRLEDPGRGIDHSDLRTFEADVQRASALGLNTYRFSVEWSRVQPRPPAWAAAVTANRSKPRLDEGQILPPERNNLSDYSAFVHDEASIDRNAIKLYQDMVDIVKRHGMEPMVTLQHMALPDWVQKSPGTQYTGDVPAYLEALAKVWYNVEDDTFWQSLRGWISFDTVWAFKQYVAAVVDPVLGLKGVRYWITLNEPVASVISASYMASIWPPGFFLAGTESTRAQQNQIFAHAYAYDIIHAALPDAHVSVSMWIPFAIPDPDFNVQSNPAAKNQWETFNFLAFLDALILGEYRPTFWRHDPPESRPDFSGRMDFIALQYYRSAYISHDWALAAFVPNSGGRFTVDITRDTSAPKWLKDLPHSELGWTIRPDGLYQVLMRLSERYGLPLMVTETGLGESADKDKAPFLVSHTESVLRAIRDGADVRGLIFWTIADNWEWHYGYQAFARFGLFRVDRESERVVLDASSFKRHANLSALCVREIVRTATRASDSASLDLLGGARRNYGSFLPDGRDSTPPSRSNGIVLRGVILQSPGSTVQTDSFVMTVTRCIDDEYDALLYRDSTGLWQAARSVTLSRATRGRAVQLVAEFGDVGDPRSIALRSEPTESVNGVATFRGAALIGQADGSGWRAEVDSANRTYKRSRSRLAPRTLRFSNLESDANAWCVGWDDTGRCHLAVRVTVDRTLRRVTSAPSLSPFVQIPALDFVYDEDGTLTGTIDGAPWEGKVLPTGIPGF